MQPNILMLGYNSHWLKQCVSDKSKYEEYMGVIADAFDAKMAVCVFRNENDGLDHSALLSEEEQLFVRLPDLLNSDRNSTLQDDLSRGVEARKIRPKAKSSLRPSASSTAIIFPSGKFDNPFQIERNLSGNSLDSQTKKKKKQRRRHSPLSINSSFGCRINKFDQFHRPLPNTKFRTQLRGGFVDVWWLQDDGGLLLLLSHLLREHNTYLPNAKLRVFTICSSKLDPIKVYQNLVELLKKFRIHFFMVHVFSEDYDRQKLYTETLEEYEELMELLKRKSSNDEFIITDEMLERTRERTYRYLRHRELLLEFSSASSVVLISLPAASSAVVLSPVYALWLELLSRDMPPMLFVRGNDNSVITFYS